MDSLRRGNPMWDAPELSPISCSNTFHGSLLVSHPFHHLFRSLPPWSQSSFLVAVCSFNFERGRKRQQDSLGVRGGSRVISRGM